MLRYCHLRTGCPETAADLTAEVFAAAFARRSSFRDEGRPARNWLYGIAGRQIGLYARRQRVSLKYRRKLGMERTALDANAIERLEARLDAGALRRALGDALVALPERQREALWLRVVDELPYGEVARRLGCSEGAARVRVCRALGVLSEHVDLTRLEGA